MITRKHIAMAVILSVVLLSAVVLINLAWVLFGPTNQQPEETKKKFYEQVDWAREKTRLSRCGENLLKIVDPPKSNPDLQQAIVVGGMEFDSLNAHHLIIESRDGGVVLRLYDPSLSDVHNGEIFWRSQPDCPKK